MDVPADRRFRFQGFCLDLDRCELTDADGRVLPLQGRPYDVLVHLLRNRERVVSKDELLAAVWPGLVVEENNLNQAISTVRRVLGDSRESPRFIHTVAGRGYRFIAELEPSPGTAHRLSRRWLLIGGISAVVLGAGGVLLLRRPGTTQVLAVLPFAPLDESQSNPAFELGVTETLINQLTDLPGLRVTPLSSARRLARDTEPRAAGQALGAGSVLHGTLQIHEGRVRLTASLLDVATGEALWAGRFDESAAHLFEIQDALADRLVTELQIELSPAARARIARRYTRDVEAWQLYLQGRYQWDRRTEQGVRNAITFFEAAERRDPRFALAAAGLSDAWSRLAVYGIEPPGAVLPIASRAAQRAVERDGSLAEAHSSLGHVLIQHDRNWRLGERHLRRALELRPSYAHAHMLLAFLQAHHGQLDAALASIEAARALEPVSVSLATAFGFVLYLRREFAAARDHLTALLESTPDAGVARHYLARTLTMSGEPARAIELLSQGEVAAPAGKADLGRAYAAAGRTSDAEREIERLAALGARGFGVGYELALIEATLGRTDRALAALERAVADQSQLIGLLNVEPALAELRDDARFRAVARSIGLG